MDIAERPEVLWATLHVLDARRDLLRRLALEAVAEGEADWAIMLEDQIARVEHRSTRVRQKLNLQS